LLLNDKTAIITDATRGLGFQISKEFAESGAAVIICSRSIANGEKSASLLKGKAYPETPDVTNAQCIGAFVRHIAERHRRLEILVNNAGYPFDRRMWNKSCHEVPEEGLERVIEVNLKRALRLSQAAIPFMIKIPAAAAPEERAEE
jgi:3-oxoacyl-[acyl-carrier protein] reductase